MRTLKKSLALVLALVMVLGFGAFASAVEFNDADEIKYAEAVAVLSGIGVINGKPLADGTYDFDPAGTLTRAEAAKIIAYLLQQQDVKATAKFTDTVGHWAEAYIAYIAGAGIVEGYAGEFNPEGTLTGAAFGKMLLGALGYDAKIEGMTGETWEVAVGALLKKANLLTGIVGFDGTADLTRETAAQMALNALFAEPVYYLTKGTAIKVDGVEIITGASPAAPSGYNTMAEDYGLVKTADVSALTDTYGRPLASQYKQTVKGVTTTIYEGTKAPLATIVDGSFDSAKEPYKYWTEGASCKFFVNAGNNKGEAGFDTLAEFEKKPGMNIEFYGTVNADGTTTITTVVATQYYFATVDVNAINKNVTLYIEEPGQMIGSGVAFDVVIPYDATAKTQSKNYQKVAALADNDAVMVLMKAGPSFNDVDYDARCTVLDVYKATPVAASKVTAKSYTGNFNGSVKLDGVSYTFANCYSQSAAAATLGAYTGTFYTDANGYLFGYTGAVSPATVYYYGWLKSYEASQYAAGSTSLVTGVTTGATAAAEKFEIVTADGTVVLDGNITVNPTTKQVTDYVNVEVGALNAPAVAPNQLVKYTLVNGKVATIAGSATEAAHESFVKGNATLTGGSFMLSDKTQVFVYNSTTRTFTVYTGYVNAPSFTDKTINHFFTTTGGVNVFDAIYVADIGAAPAATVVYFADVAYEETLNAKNETIYTYSNVYVDGVKTTITTSAEINATPDTVAAGDLWTATVTNGVTTLTSKQSANKVTAQSSTYFNNGAIKYVNDATKYFVINTVAKTVTAAEDMPAAALGYDNYTMYVAKGTTATDPATVVYYYVAVEA